MVTHVGHLEVPVGPEDNGEDGENNLQERKLEGAKFEQEERAPRAQKKKRKKKQRKLNVASH